MRIFTSALALATALSASANRASLTDNPSADFYTAIRANDLARLKTLLASGPGNNVDGVHDNRGVTPLMHAAVVGSADAMRLLLDAGADVNARNDVGSTALMWSATDLAKVRLLLEHGADVNAASERHRTALLVAAMADGSAPIVRLLIAKGADVHVVDRVNVSAMHAATLGGDADTVRLLIDAGAEVDTRDAGGYTPLMNAAQHGNLRAVQMLLAKGASVSAVTEMGDMQSHVSRRVKNGPLGL